jgi:sialate O-acetylesterase
MKSVFVFVISFLVINLATAQNKSEWNDKKCAVVLTYDDALNVHLDQVIPALDSMNFKATFYLTGYFPGFSQRMDDWRKAAINGHELGNHTLFHPCTGNTAGREWVSAERDLSKYTIQRIEEEIRMNNILLQSIDGKTNRTFAYPCGDMAVGGDSYVEKIKDDFSAARGTRAGILQMKTIDLYNIDAYGMHGQTGDQMIELVNKALNENGLVVFLFHGVGGEHNLNVSLQAHRELLHYLKKNEGDIWVAPLIDVVEWINEKK